MPFLPRDRGAPALEALNEVGNVSERVHSHEQVDVRGDHPDLENVSSFLPGYAAKKSA
jgi:hypothetical protein